MVEVPGGADAIFLSCIAVAADHWTLSQPFSPLDLAADRRRRMRRGGFSRPNWGPVRRAPVPHIWKDQRTAPAVVELWRPSASRKDPTLSASELDGLIATLPAPPHNFFVYHTGPVAAKLLFWQWPDAPEAVFFFWKRRLEGEHLLTPKAFSGRVVQEDD